MPEGLSGGISEKDLRSKSEQSAEAKKNNLVHCEELREEQKKAERREEVKKQIQEIIESIKENGIPLYSDNSLEPDSGFEKTPGQLRNEVELGLFAKLENLRRKDGVLKQEKVETKKRGFISRFIPDTLGKRIAAGIFGVGTSLFGFAPQVMAEGPKANLVEVQEVPHVLSKAVLEGMGLTQEVIKSSNAGKKIMDFVAGGKFWGENDNFDGTVPLELNLSLKGLGEKVKQKTIVMLSPKYMDEVCRGKNFKNAADLTTYIESVVNENNALRNYKTFMTGSVFYVTDKNSFYCFSSSTTISPIDRPYVNEVGDTNIPHFVKFMNDGTSKTNQEYLVTSGSLNGVMAIDLKTGGLVVVDGATCQITGDYSYTPVLSETGEETGKETGHKVTFRSEFENIGDRQKVFEDMDGKVEKLKKDGVFNFDKKIILNDSSGNPIFEVAIGGKDGLDEEYVNKYLKPTVEKINNRIDPSHLENSGPVLILRTTAGLNATYESDKSINRIYLNQDNIVRSESKQKKEDIAVTLFVLLTEYHGLQIRMWGGEEKEGLLKSLMSRDTIEEWFNNKLITKGEYENLKIGADNDIIQYITKWYGIKNDQKDEIYKYFSKKYRISDANKWTSELLNSILGPELKKFWNM